MSRSRGAGTRDEESWGRLLSREEDWKVTRTRRERGTLVVLPIALLVVSVVFSPWMWLRILSTGLFACTSGLLFLFAYTYEGMRVYETGIAYTSFLMRIFAPWDMLMIHKVHPNSIVLRKIHTLEAAIGGIPGKEGYVKFLTLNTDMTDFHATRDYMIDAIYRTPRLHNISAVY